MTDAVERVARALAVADGEPAECERHYRAAASAAISAHLSALAEVGWVVVPAEPTEAMLAAGMAHESCKLVDEYRAMIAAATASDGSGK